MQLVSYSRSIFTELEESATVMVRSPPPPVPPCPPPDSRPAQSTGDKDRERETTNKKHIKDEGWTEMV